MYNELVGYSRSISFFTVSYLRARIALIVGGLPRPSNYCSLQRISKYPSLFFVATCRKQLQLWWQGGVNNSHGINPHSPRRSFPIKIPRFHQFASKATTSTNNLQNNHDPHRHLCPCARSCRFLRQRIQYLACFPQGKFSLWCARKMTGKMAGKILSALWF